MTSEGAKLFDTIIPRYVKERPQPLNLRHKHDLTAGLTEKGNRVAVTHLRFKEAVASINLLRTYNTGTRPPSAKWRDCFLTE